MRPHMVKSCQCVPSCARHEKSGALAQSPLADTQDRCQSQETPWRYQQARDFRSTICRERHFRSRLPRSHMASLRHSHAARSWRQYPAQFPVTFFAHGAHGRQETPNRGGRRRRRSRADRRSPSNWARRRGPLLTTAPRQGADLLISARGLHIPTCRRRSLYPPNGQRAARPHVWRLPHLTAPPFSPLITSLPAAFLGFPAAATGTQKIDAGSNHLAPFPNSPSRSKSDQWHGIAINFPYPSLGPPPARK